MLAVCLAAFAACAGLQAAPPTTRDFDIPPGEAESAIEQFVRQAGVDVVFEVTQVEGAQTKAVRGKLTPREALERLVSGTGLLVLQDEKTGALTVTRRAETASPINQTPTPMKKHNTLIRWLAALFVSAGPVSLSAQSNSPADQQAGAAPAPSASSNPVEVSPGQNPNQQEEIVQMSQFVVRTTAGMGYVDANSASGFKTSQSLLDIPQTNLVLTQDFLNDIPVLYDNDLLMYAGVSSYFREFGPMIRGSRVGNALIDGMQQGQTANNFFDNDYIDSMEILKGTVAVLYQGGGTTGVVIYSSKKPLTITQDTVSVGGSSLGLVRGSLDFTGPIGTLGDTLISYRLVAGWQTGGQYFVNHNVWLEDIHPTLEADYKNTKIIVAYDSEASNRVGDSNAFLTPSGNLYVGGNPRKYEEFEPPGVDNFRYDAVAVRAYLIQKFSDNWEMKFSAVFSPSLNSGSSGFADHIDWSANEFYGDWVYQYVKDNLWQLVDDVTGKYYIGMLKCQSTFGFAHYQLTTVNESRSDPTQPLYEVPIGPNMWQSFQALTTPTVGAGDFPVPANPGDRQVSYQDNIYFQEQIDAIPNLVSLVAGWAFVQTESVTDSDIAKNTPYTATDESFHLFAPRLGVIVHLTKDSALYALDSQNASLNGALDYYGNRLPSVHIISKEIGIKTAFLDGRFVLDAAAFNTSQTNQAVFGGQVNFYGNPDGYSVPEGTTNNRGWDSSLAVAPLPGLQAIATAYRGTVENQAGVWGSPSFGNMWSLVVRYDFAKETALHGVTVGTGWSRTGSRWISSAGEIFPAGYPSPSRIRFQQGTMAMAFVDYRYNKNWVASLTCNNLLDENFPMSSQGPEEIDASMPIGLTLRLSYTY